MTTFQDHAARYEQCARPPSVPADGRRRFVAWRAAAGTALGNALNILAHAYFVALWSRRELIVGPGLVPDLLCGRWGVITRCGLPRWTDGAVALALNGTKDADPRHWIEHVREADAEGDARLVGANIHWSSYSGYAQVAAKEPRVMRALQALGCDGPVRDAHDASNRSAVPASTAFSRPSRSRSPPPRPRCVLFLRRQIAARTPSTRARRCGYSHCARRAPGRRSRALGART